MDIKRLFVFLMVGIFMISMASAYEFDNVKHYDPVTREVTINNCNLWVGVCLIEGAKIGKARLNTPLNVDVPTGYQKVAEFDLWAYMDYNDIIKNIDLYDLNEEDWENHKFQRDFDLKYKSFRNVMVDDYELVCVDDPNSLNGTQVCVNEIVGDHIEKVEDWRKVTSAVLKKNEVVTVGIFTEVYYNDHVEWIPSFYGIEVGEWASWTSNLNTSLISSYIFNESSGNLIDMYGSNDMANTGVDYEQDSPIPFSYLYVVGDKSEDASFSLPTVNNVYTYNFVSYISANTSNGVFFEWATGSRNNVISLQWGAVDDGDFLITTKVSGWENGAMANVTRDLYDEQWIMWTLIHDTDTDIFSLYMNATKVYTYAPATEKPSYATGGYLTLGGHQSTELYNGSFDSFSMWNRALNQSEITYLFNNGLFLEVWQYEDPDKSPSITLNSPTENASYNTLQTITFNFTAYDDIELVDVKLYVNAGLNQTNASGINNTNYLFDLELSDGEYLVYGKATDNGSFETTTETINITIDTTPFIDFLTPPTLVNYANITQEYIPMKVNVSTPYFYNLSYDLFNVNGTAYTQYYETETYDINFTDMPDAHYHYNVTICTTTNKCNSTETRHINHDATSPTITNALNLSDQATFSLPINSTWNYTASDDHIDSCYYNTTDHATEVITCNVSIGTEWATGGNKTVMYCANDTFGNEGCLTDYVLISYIQETQAESQDPTVEGLTVTWNLTVNLSNIPTTTAYIVVNDTLIYPATTTTAGTNGYIFEFVKEIPDNWGNTTGNILDWFWNYTIVGVVTHESTDTDNITVYELAIDDCSVYGEVILDFSLYDEELGFLVNETAGANVEIDLILTSQANSSISLTYNHTWVNESNPQVCIPNNVLNDTQYEINFTIGFDSTDRVWEFYYLDSGTLNSTKVFDTQTDYTINLMDLKTVDSTSFLFNYFDVDGLAVDRSIVHVYRKYIGSGVFFEVERGKGDQNGDTIVHLVEEDVIYYFVISLDGTVLHTSSTYTALCQETPCTIQIEASGGSAVFDDDWDLVDDGAYSISSSASTRETVLSYATTGASTWNYTVYRYESDGSYTALNTSSSTGTSGTITLNVPQSAGNVSFFASVVKDDEFVNSEWVNFEAKAQDYIGTILSLFLAGLLILSLGLMSVSKGGITIVWVMLGVIISSFLGLMTTELSTGVSVVVYLCLAGGMILWKLTRRRN